MSQFLFGAGILWGTPLTDATGATISNPTPVQFGTLQDVSVDMSFENKLLHGQNQFPVAVGRGKGKVSCKAKNAQVNGALWNSIMFGQTVSNGIFNDVYDTTGAAIPGTPYQITPTVPDSGTWLADLGVRNSAGLPMTRVASSPAADQYSVAAGVYTFAAADTTETVFIDYQYTATSTSAKNMTIVNQPMGYAPVFRCDLKAPYQGKQLVLTLYNCIANKLMLASKQDDFWFPEFDFEAFANASGQILRIGMSE